MIRHLRPAVVLVRPAVFAGRMARRGPLSRLTVPAHLATPSTAAGHEGGAGGDPVVAATAAAAWPPELIFPA